MARLRVESGKSAGKVVEFDKQAVVGRGETANLQIHDLKASREHCRVFDQGGTWAVADLNSRNGIKVNGVQTTRKNLSHGDKVEIGETVLVFEVSGAKETGDSVPPVKAAAAPAAKPAPAAAKPAAAPAKPAAAAAKPAAAPAAKAPAPKPAALVKGGAADKKAAAMAAARADAAKAKSAPAPKSGTAPATGQGLEISDRALQFHKIDAKKASILDVDLSQSAGTSKLLVVVGCVAFLAVLIWVVVMLFGE